MFKIDSESDLIATFRPRDRKKIEIPKELTFPTIVRDYLSWTHPAGGRVYLVFAIPKGLPTGIVFDTNGGSGAQVAQMCNWCHCSGMGNQISLISAQLNSNKRVGVYACSDLSCRKKLEDEANRSGDSVLPSIEKLIARMAHFASDALQINMTRDQK